LAFPAGGQFFRFENDTKNYPLNIKAAKKAGYWQYDYIWSDSRPVSPGLLPLESDSEEITEITLPASPIKPRGRRENSPFQDEQAQRKSLQKQSRPNSSSKSSVPRKRKSVSPTSARSTSDALAQQQPDSPVQSSPSLPKPSGDVTTTPVKTSSSAIPSNSETEVSQRVQRNQKLMTLGLYGHTEQSGRATAERIYGLKQDEQVAIVSTIAAQRRALSAKERETELKKSMKKYKIDVLNIDDLAPISSIEARDSQSIQRLRAALKRLHRSDPADAEAVRHYNRALGTELLGQPLTPFAYLKTGSSNFYPATDEGIHAYQAVKGELTITTPSSPRLKSLQASPLTPPSDLINMISINKRKAEKKLITWYKTVGKLNAKDAVTATQKHLVQKHQGARSNFSQLTQTALPNRFFELSQPVTENPWQDIRSSRAGRLDTRIKEAKAKGEPTEALITEYLKVLKTLNSVQNYLQRTPGVNVVANSPNKTIYPIIREAVSYTSNTPYTPIHSPRSTSPVALNRKPASDSSLHTTAPPIPAKQKRKPDDLLPTEQPEFARYLRLRSDFQAAMLGQFSGGRTKEDISKELKPLSEKFKNVELSKN
jgi:hypothetical protein